MAAMNDISFSWRAYLKMKRLDGIVYAYMVTLKKNHITMTP